MSKEQYLIISFLIFMLLEMRFPILTKQSFNWRVRVNNLFIFVLSAIAVKIIFPLGLVSISEKSLFNVFSSLPIIIRVILELLLLDFVIYWQHRAMHLNPYLWRIHRTHHLVNRLDTSAGLRFHPIEILFSYSIKALVVFVLGPLAISIIAYEFILTFTALFNHSSLRLPQLGEKIISRFVVTPALHFRHHSVETDEMNSNFGTVIPLWDKVFKTYIETNQNNLVHIKYGLKASRDKNIIELVVDPFSE